MNMNQFTQKSLAAIQGAQDLAVEYGQQQIEQQHLLLALVSDGEGFIPQLLTAMGMTVPSFEAAVRAEVNKLPKVSGGGREADKVYVAQDVDRALKSAGNAGGLRRTAGRPAGERVCELYEQVGNAGTLKKRAEDDEHRNVLGADVDWRGEDARFFINSSAPRRLS